MKFKINQGYHNVLHDNTDRNNKITLLSICVVPSFRSSCYSFAVSPTHVFWTIITVNSTTSTFRCIIISQNMDATNIGTVY
jgi:hypothetical protein